MRVLIVGKHGQLAWEMQRTVPDGITVEALASDELDIANKEDVKRVIGDISPHVVINCAAYTAVDKAEQNEAGAYAVNEIGAENLALACNALGARMLHVSTDFVFDGLQSKPYRPSDATAPLGVYGASKLAGERRVRAALPDSAVIVRTAWVYSSHGNNFVKTMLRLMADKPQLGVVVDQVGTPTWAKGLAHWLWNMAQREGGSGTYHWTDAGVASWYDFAVAIQELAVAKKLLSSPIPIRPIPSSAYPTPAQRPQFSVLDKTSAVEISGIELVHWREQLNNMLDELI